MAGVSKKPNGRYEAGKLASDIAYIKAGIIDLQEKFDTVAEWKGAVDVRLGGIDARSEANVARITVLQCDVDAQSGRMDAVLRESRWTGGISGMASVVAAAIVAAIVGPRN